MKATTVINILVYVLVLLFITLLSFQWFRVKEIKPVNTNIHRINYEEIIPPATTPPPTIHVETVRPTTPAPIRTEPPQVQKNDHIASKALASSFQKLLAKNIQTGEGQSAAILQEEKLNDVKSYSADHEYLLVLFTTEEKPIQTATQNILYMFDLFQKHFNCRCIFYTTNPEYIRKCKDLDIVTMNTTLNPFGVPYIGDMYKNAGKLFKSSFYGYINADILVSTDIFSVLEYMKDVQEKQYPNRLIEICHNAYNAYPPRFSNALTLHTYNRDFREAIGNNKGQRGVSSVDMFILSKQVLDIEFEPIVIARSRVDSYMMYMVVTKRGIIFDSADAAPTVHQGLERYTKRARGKQAEDYKWNEDILKKRFSTLDAAAGNIRKTPSGYNIERRVNIRKRKP